MKELAKKLTEVEGKKKQVDIAQMNEIVKLLPKVLREYPPEQILNWIYGKGKWKQVIFLI